MYSFLDKVVVTPLRRLTIAGKIMLIIVSCYLVLVGVFAYYSSRLMSHYRTLKCQRIAAVIAEKQEQVAGISGQLARNVMDLANASKSIMAAPRESWDQHFLGLLERNLSSFGKPLGNGIFMLPGTVNGVESRWFLYHGVENGRRYSVNESNKPQGFIYENRQWYKDVMAGIERTGSPLAWSAPYKDANLPYSTVISVGCGIFAQSEGSDAPKLVGIAMLDWRLSDVVKELTEIKPTPGTFVVLLDPIHNTVVAETATADIHAAFPAGMEAYASSWVERVKAAPADPKCIDKPQVDFNGNTYIAFDARLNSGMQMVVFVPRQELLGPLRRANLEASAMLLAFALAVLVITVLLNRLFIVKPMGRLMTSVGRLGQGELQADFDESGSDEISRLGQAFNQMVRDLRGYVDRLQQETRTRERMAGELQVASQIQSDLLPSSFPAFPNRHEFEIFARMRPAREVGGDFYDFCLLDGDHLYFAVADVSGKGIPAALFMMCSRTILRNNAGGKMSLKEILEHTNNSLCENNKSNMFVTALVGVLEISTGRLAMANAGHNPPLLRRADGSLQLLKLRRGFVLGGMEDIPYSQDEVLLQPGDALYCYTDGITEAQDSAGELFGSPRLEESLKNCTTATADGLITAVGLAVDGFVAGAQQADDMTELCIVYRGTAAKEVKA